MSDEWEILGLTPENGRLLEQIARDINAAYGAEVVSVWTLANMLVPQIDATQLHERLVDIMKEWAD